MDQLAEAKIDTRSCTCHPDDNPPVPCQRQFALTDCRQAATLTGAAKVFHELWQSAERELQDRPTAREQFEAIIASLNYDGPDANSLTVGEIRRALP